MLQSLQEQKRKNTRRSLATRDTIPQTMKDMSTEEITKNIIKELTTILTINPALPEPGKTLVVGRPRKNNNTLRPLVEIRIGIREVRRLPLGD